MIGILGGGQLGRMLALAGHPLGVRCRVLDPAQDAPAASVAEHFISSFDDLGELTTFARDLSVVTYEFENVPVASAAHLAQFVPVLPAPVALEVAQDRWVEKSTFRELGIDTPKFAKIDSLEELHSALDEIGLPAVLKTRRLGYDGKGQALLRHHDEAAGAWEALGRTGLILESFVRFDRELSILAVRGRKGETSFYPLIENLHRGGILRRSICPAVGVRPETTASARSIATRLLDRLGYVGLIAIELFDVGGTLLANEFAPRVHNSGHGSIEGSESSQFENHLRAILGLPLGSTDSIAPTVMFNFIGQMPPAEEVLAIPGAHLHDYGKESKPGRKVGHVTIRGKFADDPEVLQRIEALLS